MYSFFIATEIFRKEVSNREDGNETPESLVVYWEAPFPCPPLFTAKSNTGVDCQLQENCVMNLSIFIIF